jgi:DNA-binding transcriptional MerR regulator
VTVSADPGRLLQIGEVTDRVDLSLRTVRYYEEVGLVAPTKRTEGGFRLFSEADVQRLLLIKSMKAFDLTLEDMGAVLEVLDRSASPGELAASELDEIEATLGRYVSLTARQLEKRRRELDDARALRNLMLERLSSCDGARNGLAERELPLRGASARSKRSSPGRAQ